MYNEINLDKLNFDLNFDTDEINANDSENDFEKILENKFKEINNLLKFMRNLPNVIFARLTGTGSCIFSAFESKKYADDSQIIFKERFPLLWSKVVENNFKHN
jgi:4-diphosphocytidyl-2C-methyl-D-erythritol kinase